MHSELVLDCKNMHGEGIFWNSEDHCVWWTDIYGSAIWSFNPTTRESIKYPMTDRVCCFAPRQSGGLIVAFADRVSLVDLKTGFEEQIATFEANNADTRTNDGRTDRQGRLIVGGMNEGSGEANSSVIRIDKDLSITKIIDGIACANSTCFSPDGKTLFFADTPDKEILAYDYDVKTGSVSNKRVHCDFGNEPGLPDGSCVDSEGGVWNAEWEGYRVVRVNPDGDIDRIIELPIWKPTCCTFGGPELDTLFITTSRMWTEEKILAKEPGSGGLFAVKPGVQGMLDMPFSG